MLPWLVCIWQFSRYCTLIMSILTFDIWWHHLFNWNGNSVFFAFTRNIIQSLHFVYSFLLFLSNELFILLFWPQIYQQLHTFRSAPFRIIFAMAVASLLGTLMLVLLFPVHVCDFDPLLLSFSFFKINY